MACSACKMLRHFFVGDRGLCRVFGTRNVSTSNFVSKSRPSTVGVPAWAKAANKRRAQTLLLEKKKTPSQIQAEVRVADVKSNKSDFLTSSRVGVHKPETRAASNEGYRMTSASGEMYLFYHPKQDYPVKHSKEMNAEGSEMLGNSSSRTGNDHSLSEPQIAEIKRLQNRDPKLWTVDILADMYNVKPLAICNVAPLSHDQQVHLEVEQDFLRRLSDYERKEYTYFKNNERRRLQKGKK
ncbi:uncharacterized protein LOC114521897 [Dendronephthya gigantea]|uniref:uncharacterized protein LOC114521897 n=1 Tax=Dendronephthya gigantea TaxID=151771 RepID=UPI00106C73AD|nr:uncharacterized protein LOC114521897 [Dendronephthya gigantea]